jgi:DNA-binding PadR family transcriptional regulator
VYLVAASVDISLARWLRSKTAARQIRIKHLRGIFKLSYATARRTLMRWESCGWLKADGTQANTSYYMLTPKGAARCERLCRA